MGIGIYVSCPKAIQTVNLFFGRFLSKYWIHSVCAGYIYVYVCEQTLCERRILLYTCTTFAPGHTFSRCKKLISQFVRASRGEEWRRTYARKSKKISTSSHDYKFFSSGVYIGTQNFLFIFSEILGPIFVRLYVWSLAFSTSFRFFTRSSLLGKSLISAFVSRMVEWKWKKKRRKRWKRR